MAYMAMWSVFIDGDDLDPIQVADRARVHAANPDHQTWRVVNIDSGDSAVVDLRERCIVPMGGSPA